MQYMYFTVMQYMQYMHFKEFPPAERCKCGMLSVAWKAKKELWSVWPLSSLFVFFLPLCHLLPSSVSCHHRPKTLQVILGLTSGGMGFHSSLWPLAGRSTGESSSSSLGTYITCILVFSSSIIYISARRTRLWCLCENPAKVDSAHPQLRSIFVEDAWHAHWHDMTWHSQCAVKSLQSFLMIFEDMIVWCELSWYFCSRPACSLFLIYIFAANC